jgi:hypothetical protein
MKQYVLARLHVMLSLLSITEIIDFLMHSPLDTCANSPPSRD